MRSEIAACLRADPPLRLGPPTAWDGRLGCGAAFARYKNLGAYCALATEVEVQRETGSIAVRRVKAAVDVR
jgi:CO/xanthine dehydrogenase Mo-binding subunit